MENMEKIGEHFTKSLSLFFSTQVWWQNNYVHNSQKVLTKKSASLKICTTFRKYHLVTKLWLLSPLSWLSHLLLRIAKWEYFAAKRAHSYQKDVFRHKYFVTDWTIVAVSDTKAASVECSEASADQVVKKETAKEWNSPARYPTEIKKEKRKAKGKPSWVPLFCCSSASVN